MLASMYITPLGRYTFPLTRFSDLSQSDLTPKSRNLGSMLVLLAVLLVENSLTTKKIIVIIIMGLYIWNKQGLGLCQTQLELIMLK